MSRSRRLRWSLAGAIGILALVAAPFAAGAIRVGAPTDAGATTEAPAVDPQVVVERQLDAKLAAAGADEKLGVFVHAREAGDIASVTAATRQHGLTVVDTFDQVGVAVAVGTVGQIRALEAETAVDYVEADQPAEYFMSTSHVATRGEEARRLQVTETTTAVEKPRGKSPKGKKSTTTTTRSLTAGEGVSGQFEGTGVSVAVIDSGVDGTHPMFQKDGKSTVVTNLKLACAFLVACTGPEGDAEDAVFVPVPGNDSDTPSMGGHGTHVASTAAGVDVDRGADGVLHGAAPGAKTVALSVGQAVSVYGGNAGLNWVLEHHREPCGAGVPTSDCPPIRVVNNSYGPLGGGEFSASSVASKLQDKLVADGVVVVWAAGNEGGDGSENVTNPPGQSPTPGVIMVASYDDAGTGTRDNVTSDFSSRGDAARRSTYPDISAPGTDITAACRPYLPVCTSGEGDYGTIGGTSMATPHVAGIVAVLLGANPALTPGEVEDILEDTAHQFTAGAAYVPDLASRNADHSTSFDKGHGLVDVVAALGRALGLAAPTGAAPEAPCVAGAPVVTDPAGDAPPTPAEESDPSLDLRSQHVSWDGTKLTFVTTIEDLGTNTFPAGAFYDVTFSRGEDALGVRASRNAAGAATFTLRKDAATVPGSAPAVSGAFDADADTITITIDNAKLPTNADGSMPVARFADGQELTDFALAVFRSYGAVGLRADAAAGSCAFILGSGTGTASPADVADEDAPAGQGDSLPSGEGEDPGSGHDGAAAEAQQYTWEGDPLLDVNPTPTVGGCLGPDDPFCDHERILVNVPAGGARVTVTVSFAEGDDFDIYLFGKDGALITDAATGDNPERFSFWAPASGVYTVSAASFASLEQTYRATLVVG